MKELVKSCNWSEVEFKFDVFLSGGTSVMNSQVAAKWGKLSVSKSFAWLSASSPYQRLLLTNA